MDGLDAADGDLLRLHRAVARHSDLARDLPAGDARKGILGFPTTRGDRFFVSLLGSAFIFILWIRLGGGELWYALAMCIPFAVAMFRFA